MSHCAYPGHVTAADCDPERFVIESPPDQRGRVKRFRVCERACWFAERRGYTVLRAVEEGEE